jgi:hypothetical protein
MPRDGTAAATRESAALLKEGRWWWKCYVTCRCGECKRVMGFRAADIGLSGKELDPFRPPADLEDRVRDAIDRVLAARHHLLVDATHHPKQRVSYLRLARRR